MLEDLCLVAVVGKAVTEDEQLTCGKELVVWVDEGQLLAEDCVSGGLCV